MSNFTETSAEYTCNTTLDLLIISGSISLSLCGGGAGDGVRARCGVGDEDVKDEKSEEKKPDETPAGVSALAACWTKVGGGLDMPDV